MTHTSQNNLGTTLCYMEMSEAEQAIFARAQRNRIAKVLRAARIRVKANKAKNNGAYVPENDYDRYLANPNGPDPRD